MKIFALTTLRNGPTDILPHWCDHYDRLGVDGLVIGVARDMSTPAINSIAGEARLPRFFYCADWLGEDADECHRAHGCRMAGATHADWILHTDVDEFQTWPPDVQVRAFLEDADRMGRRAFVAPLVDRVTADGTLAALKPLPESIFDQYPTVTDFTVRYGDTNAKLVAARFGARIVGGHHASADTPMHFVPGLMVHHFKWRAGIVERLTEWLEQTVCDEGWKLHTRKALEMIEANGGKVPV